MKNLAFHTPDALSVAAFVGILIFIVAAWLAAVHTASKRSGKPPTRITLIAGLGTFLWLALLGGLTASGKIATHPFPFLPIVFSSIMIVTIAVGISPFGKMLSGSIPLSALVGFQGFRLPLELVLHSWAIQKTIPQTMTWTGSNFDIVSGIVALIAFPFVERYRWTAWVANVAGSVLLLNVMRVAILSSPLPFAWGTEPPLALGMHLPFAWIVPVCVGGALLGHILLFRKLLKL